ncbi:MAG: hypothetical protein LBS20_08220 [Prevotella sp.]|jgi:hypothetical protein|nr:hypothetical protein [Prevotella sp.]
MKKQTILYSVFIACGTLILAVAGCSKDDETETVLAVERDGANFANSASSTILAVITNINDWTVTTEDGQTWLTADREGNAVKLSVTESNEREIRTSYAVVTAGNRTKMLVVKQLGYEAAIVIEPEVPDEVPATGGTVTLNVTANVDLTVTIPVTWITKSDTPKALPMAESIYTYTVEANQSNEPRSTILTFAETGGTLSKQVEIVQAGCPPTIESSSIRAETQPGAIKLIWTSLYTSHVEVNYTITDPLTGATTPKTVMVTDAGQVVIDDLRARYGEIEFSLQPFNDKGESGEIIKIKQTAGAAPVQTFTERTETWIQIPTVDVLSRVWTNSYETAEGNLSNLVDGIEMGQVNGSTYENSTNYFHMRYNARNGMPVPQLPNYIVIDLGREVKELCFSYVGRTTGKDDPTAMDVLVSNAFTPVIKISDNKPEHVIDATRESSDNAQLLQSFPTGDNARVNNYRGGTGGQPTKWKSEDLKLASGDAFRYIWFKITAIQYTGDQWAVLSELKVFEVKPPRTYDPETEVETPL